MANDIPHLALWIGVTLLIICASLFFFFGFDADEKNVSSSPQTEDAPFRRSAYDVMERAMHDAAATNESMRALFRKPYRGLGGIYNESGMSEYYICIYNYPVENRSSYYEIIVANETLTSLNHITELPEYIRKISTESKIESESCVADKADKERIISWILKTHNITREELFAEDNPFYPETTDDK